MRYDAFISYRHTPLDMEMAKKIHTGLETYKIPRSVRIKTGKKKMGRVFRDQEELPIGSDLDDNIETALAGSEYLIVICSPRTPESYWVCKEIETFIKMHGRHHVLAVLIEGEPDESFPPMLLIDENGDPVEPLAADIRGETPKERNTKFKTEILRLAAPVIGCTYDELKQRHRERMIKRTITIASSAAAVVAVAGTAFGIYNAGVASKMAKLAAEKSQLADEKTRLADEITVQYQGKQENQSRFFAEESLSLLNSGDREDAVLVALEALPSEEDDRPYVPEAENALSRALYAYEYSNSMTPERNLTHDLPVKDMAKSYDGTKLITTDNGYDIYVWDVETWELITKIEPTITEFNHYNYVECLDADSTGVYVRSDFKLIKYDYEGNEVYSVDNKNAMMDIDVCGDGKLYLVGADAIEVVDASNGEVVNTIESTVDAGFTSRGIYYKDYELYVVGHYDSDLDSAYVTIVDTKTDTAVTPQLSEGYFIRFYPTQNNNIAVLSFNHDLVENDVTDIALDLFDRQGNKLWTTMLDAHVANPVGYNTQMKAHNYELNGEEHHDIIITIDGQAFTIDEKTGELVTTFNLGGDATMLAVMIGSQYGRVGYSQGGIDFVDFRKGQIYPEYAIDTHDSVRSAEIVNNMIIFTSYKGSDARIISFHEAPDLEDYYTTADIFYASYMSPDFKYYALRLNTDFGTFVFLDNDGNELYTFDKGNSVQEAYVYPDVTYLLDHRSFWRVDPYNRTEEEFSVTRYGFDEYSFDMTVSDDGSAGVFWANKHLAVVHMGTMESIMETDTEDTISNVMISADNKTLYIGEGKKPLYTLDIASGETKSFNDEKLTAIKSVSGERYMVRSHDDNYAAIFCSDGNVRVVDTKSYETCAEIPMRINTTSFMKFTDDGTHLVLQGDDYKIRIWDIEGKTFTNTIDANSEVLNIISDEDSDLMAICLRTGLYLCDKNTYGCVAEVDSAVLYLPGDDSILVSKDNQEIKRIHYKNYKQLIEEAKKQFPNSSLSDEKKVKYNIG